MITSTYTVLYNDGHKEAVVAASKEHARQSAPKREIGIACIFSEDTRPIAKCSFDYLDLGIDFRDFGPWRSYHLDTHGDTLSECLVNATISEIDQDGGELDCYDIDYASSEVYRAVVDAITKALKADQDGAQ